MSECCRRCKRLMIPTSSGAPGALVAALMSSVHSDCLLALRAEMREMLAVPQTRERRIQAFRLYWATRGKTAQSWQPQSLTASGARMQPPVVRVKL